MFLRIALFTVPTAAVGGAVLVLDAVHAAAGIAVAVLGVIAVFSGSAFGYFADRLPEVPRLRPGGRSG